MPNSNEMITAHTEKPSAAIFITFSGNCKEALLFYQTCFGGVLQFETFEGELEGYATMPVVNGSLLANRINIYGSDLVHNEGRRVGNYISIFLQCNDKEERNGLIEKLKLDNKNFFITDHADQKLVEIMDDYEVRWILGI